MKRMLSLALAVLGILPVGCSFFKSKSAPMPVAPAHTIAIVTPDNSLSGKVVSYNSVARFVVLNFPARRMPNLDQRLFLYRAGLKVAEVRVTGPQNDDNIVADLVSGEVKTGDDVRDQ